MRIFCTILLLLLAGLARSEDGRADSVRARVDSIEGMVMHYLTHKDDKPTGPLELSVSQALEASRRVGYAHGIAVGLACQAVMVGHGKGDWVLCEKLSRESLDWFGRTDNKYGITMAYYSMGYSIFAQSEFDEALHYFGLAREIAHERGSHFEEVFMLTLMSNVYRERGDYGKAFDYLRQSIQLSESVSDPQLTKMQYLPLAGLFVQIEDYASAEKYFRQALAGQPPGQTDPWDLSVYAELMTRQHKYDSALYYYGHMDSAGLKPTELRVFLVSKGEYYLFREEYAAALPYFTRSLIIQRQMNDRNQIMRCLIDAAKAYAGLGDNASAFRYVGEGVALARLTDARQYIRDGCRLLYQLYDKEGRTDSAYSYYRAYITMKDSVMNDQLKGRFASYGFEQQIRLLNQDKELEDACLREEMMTKNLLILGILVLLLLTGIYVWIIRLKRRNEEHRRKRAEDELEIQRLEGERAKAALQQRTKELEVQALRSQMNPHFIFNCLNAINRFILGHETEAASDYLTKFSRLMRMIMNHSRHSYVTLSEEIEVLQLYLDMERLRFKDAFDYSIIVEDEIDSDEIRVPPLLVQPFVENAVWHGLMHKDERGSLTIDFRLSENELTCVIRDNGIGRREAGKLKSKSAEKHKSMGLQITAERMALLTGADDSRPFFLIEDLYDVQGEPAGTRVTLIVRVNYPTGEPAEPVI
jgi:tetratricopeptide (TPR) repeat protein